MTDISVVIAWRGGDPQREKIKDWCLERWAELGVEAVLGEEGGHGPFNASMGANNAARRASGDIFLILGADTAMTAQDVAEVPSRLSEHPWWAMYPSCANLSEDGTRRALRFPFVPDRYPDEYIASEPLGCTAGLAVTREAYWGVGGFDEHFQGWGWEDNAFRDCLTYAYGPPVAPPFNHSIANFWHVPQGETPDTRINEARWRNHYNQAAVNARLRAGQKAIYEGER